MTLPPSLAIGNKVGSTELPPTTGSCIHFVGILDTLFKCRAVRKVFTHIVHDRFTNLDDGKFSFWKGSQI
jgi:hypothetical protein